MIKIGNISIKNKVFLAPMSGVTDLPFRRLVKKFGADILISEMIASMAMIKQTKESIRKCQKDYNHYPTSVQLAGCDPDVMSEAAKLNEDLGADIIDINFGCPVKKVVNGFAGSALMKNEKLAAKIISSVVKAVKVPVTVKMRMGWNQENLNAPTLSKIAEELGVKMIVIHGRTRCQMYNGVANWSFIQNIKNIVKIPVIVNGDIKNYHDVKESIKLSSADGAMIGRACYGKPWLIKEINSNINGKSYKTPSLMEQKNIILEHFDEMICYYGEKVAIPLARKHIGWYSKGIKDSANFRSKINTSLDKKKVKELINNFYDSAISQISIQDT